ncbi:glutamate--tRNA ligase [Nodosilinea sp. LEGE 07088]|uniref:glutamate--tRNA ligase n=1 Tax=Nodosilinea sp. LEGE 07088 TaxID=2777968 RepID=UPI001881C58C|nr:glutamate--tRNA ligase [Nodosilinea sp. LEGE 07088]MBE9141336.1 glutamate--tRNA ligase [Nodosilinea sp. LEGE 07088]
MTVRVRIAPSPTGNLHIGTARTAVFNWLFARHEGGQFILRIEDTDEERSKPEFTENILSGLRWLGLDWDEGPFFQTQRLDLYRQAIQTLLDQGLAYRAYDTPTELDAMREAQKAKNQAPRYDNRHRDLTPEQQAAFEAEGRPAVIRFKIDDSRTITWTDLVRGPVTWQASDLGGDMVVARASSSTTIGQPLYNLAVVVDDIDMAITHVIRGEDHIANTAKQILLYEALEAAVPAFAHTPLILNQTGQKLSKRDGVTSISDFQNMGFVAPALANYMTLLGWSAPDAAEQFTLDQAAQQFSFDRVNKAGAKFDWDKLDWLNSQYLHSMEPAALLELTLPYLQAAGYAVDPEADQSWLLPMMTMLAPSLTRLTDVVEQSRFFFTETVDFADDAKTQVQLDGVEPVLAGILTGLTEQPPATIDDLKALVNEVTKAQGVKKGLVMKSMRAALMGALQGPDLMASWLILRQRGFDVARLKEALALI